MDIAIPGNMVLLCNYRSYPHNRGHNHLYENALC